MVVISKGMKHEITLPDGIAKLRLRYDTISGESAKFIVERKSGLQHTFIVPPDGIIHLSRIDKDAVVSIIAHHHVLVNGQ